MGMEVLGGLSGVMFKTLLKREFPSFPPPPSHQDAAALGGGTGLWVPVEHPRRCHHQWKQCHGHPSRYTQGGRTLCPEVPRVEGR